MYANYLIHRNQASEEYDIARRKALELGLRVAIRGQRNALISVDDIRAGVQVHGECYGGVRQVLVQSIVSSIGRSTDFDKQFRPRHDRTRERWIRVADAHLHNIALPPVQLLKIGDAYVVTDGNHRVSVARHFGVEYIDAEIIEYVTSCVPANVPSKAMSGSERKWRPGGRYNFRLMSLLGQRA
ncbi:MAG TPA: hypothetical protein VEX13_04345 [Chloroflexia bacterium]|nr:hypothetical protein [Chloroflexia bacterium]